MNQEEARSNKGKFMIIVAVSAIADKGKISDFWVVITQWLIMLPASTLESGAVYLYSICGKGLHENELIYQANECLSKWSTEFLFLKPLRPRHTLRNIYDIPGTQKNIKKRTSKSTANVMVEVYFQANDQANVNNTLRPWLIHQGLL